MRIDHHAYQRATKVAGFGFLLQSAIGIGLLVFALMTGDTALRFASFYVLTGVLVWLGLIILFHQHKLERLEALEEDELASARGGVANSVFERSDTVSRVAAKRLELMHNWLMPALSLIIALALGGLAWWMIRYMGNIGKLPEVDFGRTRERGWAVAICLSVAAVSFIFSRFVAGMAKQQAWHNLRGGAAYMVGNALVMFAVAAGLIMRFFERENQPSRFIEWIGWAIPIFMIALGAEIVLNFILNLYRPRVPGEVPRPAFDSKALSLLATPDSIVRSLNEAVNYQFGFDVTSSWGYQLLLRSFAWLLGMGILVMILLSTMVIVEPHQQAVKLRFGRVIGEPGQEVYGSGVMWKLPWPFESAEVYDVTRTRNLHLTPKYEYPANMPEELRTVRWDSSDPPKTDVPVESFVVASPTSSSSTSSQSVRRQSNEGNAEQDVDTQIARATLSREQQAVDAISAYYSLVDAEVVLQYRIRHDALLDYLTFAPETVGRRQILTDRERLLRAMALAEVSAHFTQLSLDEALSPGRTNLTADLVNRIQGSFDKHKTGVEVVAVSVPVLMPAAGAAQTFEELNISIQAKRQRIAQAERSVFYTHTTNIGDAALTELVLKELNEYERLKAAQGVESLEAIEQRQKVEALLARGGGEAAQSIAQAETERWVTLMSRQAEAVRVESQGAAYRAAPELYRQREQMRLYKRLLPNVRKYIIAIDSARISIDVDLKHIDPQLDFLGAREEEMQKKVTP